MHNRGWRDIVADLLEITKTPTNKTTIMYKCILSFDLLKEYLALTQNAGLLELDPKNGKYQTTEKGLEYLQLIAELNLLVNRKDTLVPNAKMVKHPFTN